MSSDSDASYIRGVHALLIAITPRKVRRLPIALLLTGAGPAPVAAQTSPPDSTAALLTRGISQALARHRAATIHDVRYNLALDFAALDSAVGRVTVRFRRSGTSDAIIDLRGRRLTRALANGQPLPPDAANGAHIQIPARLLVPDENVIDFSFVASRPAAPASSGATTQATAATTSTPCSSPPTRISSSPASTSPTSRPGCA